MVARQRNALPGLLTDELSSQAALPPNTPPPPLLGSGFGISPPPGEQSPWSVPEDGHSIPTWGWRGSEAKARVWETPLTSKKDLEAANI